MQTTNNRKCYIAIVFIVITAVSGSVFADMLSESEPENRGPVTDDIKRPLRYRPDGTDFVIENGCMRFNRILYGTNTAFGIYAGDRPEFLMYLPGKGGTLRLGIVSEQKNKWLIDADNIIARYRPGKMLYKIHDAILHDGEMNIEVLAMSDAEGMLVLLQTSEDTADFDLVWAFGGSNASQGGRRNLDTVGTTPESECYLEPPDCKDNEFTIDGATFGMQGKAGYVVGRVPTGSILKVADANILDTPTALWNSSQSALPVLAGRLSVSAGKTIMFALKKSKPGDESLKAERPPKLLRTAEAFRKSVAEKVKVNTPDPFINAAVGTMCTAADAIWEPPTYLHGASAWRTRYTGWRHVYVADVFGWHDRAKMHFRAYGRAQRTTPAAANPYTDNTGIFAYGRLEHGSESPSTGKLSKLFWNAENFRRSIAEKVKVNTPDPFINAAVGAMCTAADAVWEPPTYMTGAVAWRSRYNGFRQAYVGDTFGWHRRAKTHFQAYGRAQRTNSATGIKPHADEDRNLTQQAEDSIMYTSGYIPYSPHRPDVKLVYNMNTVFIDQLLSHFLWNGDIEFVREMWPVIERHLAWERRCFDPDDDGLYESYACTWASDALAYSGGAATHISAYTYRSHLLAARFAELIGKDHKPYRQRAEKILKAIHKELWLTDRGWYAENKDLLGLGRLHPSAQLWTVYHSIDSGVPDNFKAYQSLRYIDTQIPHIPVCGPSVPQGNYVMLPSSTWKPYTWSINLVAAEEVAHTALAYWQAGRRQKAFRLFKSTILDGMYMGRTPGNLHMTSTLDASKGREKYTDFSDTVGTYSRALIEGMFGIVPDVFAGELLIRPGLPPEWEHASIETPDIVYSYKREGKTERFKIVPKFRRPMRLRLRVEARYDRIKSVTVNGKKTKWKILSDTVGRPQIEIVTDQAERYSVAIHWHGSEPVPATYPAIAALGEKIEAKFASSTRLLKVYDPQKVLDKIKKSKRSFKAIAAGRQGYRTVFAQVRQGDLTWWLPVNFEIRKPFDIVQTKKQTSEQLSFHVLNNTAKDIYGTAVIQCGGTDKSLPLRIKTYGKSAVLTVPAQNAVVGSNPVVVDMGKGRKAEGTIVNWTVKPNIAQKKLKWDTVDLSGSFNDRVVQIFRNKYLSPRSPYCSLQIPVHGYGNWCRYKSTFSVNDTGLRAAAGEKGLLTIPQGIPFKTPGTGSQPNIVFTSQWDNYPNEMTMPLTGSASHIYLLMAGSTNAMQSQFDNGKVIVGYTDGTCSELALRNPTTWWPIDRDYFENQHAYYKLPKYRPVRLHLQTGKTHFYSDSEQLPGFGETGISGGGASVLDIPLDEDKKLKSLTVRTTANEVVIGLMSATLLRSVN